MVHEELKEKERDVNGLSVLKSGDNSSKNPESLFLFKKTLSNKNLELGSCYSDI